MADRAVGPERAGEEIFDLSKDARWQARLEEARALREIALKKKSGQKDRRARPKPWEVDGQDEPPQVALLHESEGSSLDLADRLEALKKLREEERRGHNGPPVEEETPADRFEPLAEDATPTPARQSSRQDRMSNPNSVFDEPTFERARSDRSAALPVSLLLSESEMEAERTNPSRASRPWLEEESARTPAVEDVGLAPDLPKPAPSWRRRLPFGIEAVILAAFITPFFVNEAAFPLGPTVSASPTFAVQAELGLPEPFVNWPKMSLSDARFYSFRATADDIMTIRKAEPAVFVRDLAPLLPVKVPDQKHGLRVASVFGDGAPARPSVPDLPDPRTALQQDRFALSFLKLLLNPVRPDARANVALATASQ